MPIQDHQWVNQHEPDCPITKHRKDLLNDLAQDPTNQYLLGAVPEYDEGGDQEVELCICPAMRLFGGEPAS